LVIVVLVLSSGFEYRVQVLGFGVRGLESRTNLLGFRV